MKKIISIFIFSILLVSILFGTKAKAFSLSSSKTGYYFTFTKDNNRNFSDEFVNYYVDGKVAYCIEPGVSMGTSGYYESTLDNIDQDKRNRILDYMYYGYYFNGQSSIEYYFATQSLIWEELLSIEQNVVVSTELFKKGNIIDIEPFKNQIINNIDIYKNQFNNQHYKVILGDSISIKDFKLNYLYDINSNELSIDTIGNTINISNINKSGTYKIDVNQLKRNGYEYIVYKNDNKQDLLVYGDITHEQKNIYIDVIGGKAIINKKNHDEDNLSNAIFKVYSINDLLIGEYTTNEDGIIVLNDLSKGRYYFKEIEAPIGYDINHDNVYFEINEDNLENNITVYDSKIVGKLIINKRDKDNMQGIPNTKINVYDSNNNLIKELITNKYGYVQIDLEYGKYYYQEVESAEGYELDNSINEIDIIKSKTYSETIYNKNIKGNLIIQKKDSDTNEYLSDAKINIYDSNMNLINKEITNRGGNISIELEYGKYYYQEVEAPNGYELDDTIYMIDIHESKENIVDIYNSKIIEDEYDVLIIDNTSNYFDYSFIIIIGVIIVKKII